MESKLLFKKTSTTKHELEQNYQHTIKTQCPNIKYFKKYLFIFYFYLFKLRFHYL